MNPIIKFFLAGIFCFPIASAFSQQASFSTTQVTLVDTSFLFWSDSNVAITVKNVGTASYTGPIDIYFTTPNTNFFPVPLCVIQATTLNPNDSIQTFCSMYFDTTNFVGGGNIVVVWSSGNSIAPADSVWDSVYLKTTGAGIHEKYLSSHFKIYPTISSDFIFVESAEKNLIPNKIFIEDVSGRIVAVISPSIDSKNLIKINTGGLNNGIYFMDILLPDKQRIISKFVKSE